MTSAMAEVLDVLARGHRSGRLTPFVGSGMSVPAFASWEKLVDRLVEKANIEQRAGDPVTRGTSAAAVLRAEGRFPDAVSKSLCIDPGGQIKITPNTMRLAAIRWPLVITTNYEVLYLAACKMVERRADDKYGRQVLGRSPADCQRVTRSLSIADQPIVWAIQGFIPDRSTPFVDGDENISLDIDDLPAELNSLADQIVLGHAEYRRVTHAAPHFRRAFAEVIRNRSLLFLGSGLEGYLLDLVAEIRELHGPSAYPHFAVWSDGNKSKEDARRNLQGSHGIQPIFLRDHDEVAGFLELLDQRIAAADTMTPTGSASRRRPKSWTYAWNSGPELTIERGYFTAEAAPGELQVFSLGDREPDLTVGRRAGPLLGGIKIQNLHWTRIGDSTLPLWTNPAGDRLGVWARMHPSDPRRPVAAIIPDADKMEYWRDLRIIPMAMVDLLDAATSRGLADVRKAAGSDPASAEERIKKLTIEPLATGSLRTFPAPSAFLQMLRGFGQWVRANPRTTSIERITLLLQPGHSGDQAILDALEADRLPVWTAIDDPAVQFWLEAPVSGEEALAVPVTGRPNDRVADTVDQVFALPSERSEHDWWIDITPAPCENWEAWRLDKVMDLTIEQFGVIPGSLLRVICHPPTPADTSRLDRIAALEDPVERAMEAAIVEQHRARRSRRRRGDPSTGAPVGPRVTRRRCTRRQASSGCVPARRRLPALGGDRTGRAGSSASRASGSIPHHAFTRPSDEGLHPADETCRSSCAHRDPRPRHVRSSVDL